MTRLSSLIQNVTAAAPKGAVCVSEGLLDRALRVIESAYACPEWLRSHRTEETDAVLDELVNALEPALFKEAR